MKRLLFPLALCLVSAISFANIRLPRLFSDAMVLQRDKPVPVWGWADPKEKVTVTFNNQSKSVTTGKDGKWRLELAAVPAGGPFTLTIKGKNRIIISDVLVGDVWLASGQSNMEMPIAGWGEINNYKQEIAEAKYPTIRQFLVPKITATDPQDDLPSGDWKTAEPANAGDFSAVAYFFARELQAKLNIPIGIINCTWGGTHVETWTSRGAFEGSPEFAGMIKGMQEGSLNNLADQKKEAVKAVVAKYQGKTDGVSDIVKTWSDPAFSDAAWHTVSVPGLWESQGLADLDGTIWYRRTVQLNAADLAGAAVLKLAKIDDEDETFVNGQSVGSSKPYNADRVYQLPAGLLREGKNVIAVRIKDTGGEGGIYGEAKDVVLETGAKKIPLTGEWKIAIEKADPVKTGIGPNSYPTLLSNAMLNPLIPYGIKGMIWYQGESNAGRAFQYRQAFPLMITDWRNRWKDPTLPFYFVQLSTYGADFGTSTKGSNWAELREAQTLTLSLPNTGMAVTTDIGDVKDIHPKNKKDVGLRLAYQALNKTYKLGQVAGGPVYRSASFASGRATVSFDNGGSALMTPDRYGYLRGFEVAGSDQVFHYARAWIEGDKVVVASDAVKEPVSVRYNWADDASDGNLFNREGLPAGPFRSDEWKSFTEKNKYEIGK
ncbi:MAG: hypothetical protein EOO09_08490 [Chitinophagaceae bacterium]|nr:MAG: hypothetical protein EOO09_08490 [Chitinophagaceae bacterium]